jgi:hypothetical protein
MKTIIGILLFTALLFGQQPQRAKGPCNLPTPCPSTVVKTQQAEDVTIHLSAEQATALEKLRVDVIKLNPANGSLVPVYSNIGALVDAMFRAKNGILDRAVQTYPPDSIKSAAEAKANAMKTEDDARTVVLAPPK